jgi:hypothetical protein
MRSLRFEQTVSVLGARSQATYRLAAVLEPCQITLKIGLTFAGIFVHSTSHNVYILALQVVTPVVSASVSVETCYFCVEGRRLTVSTTLSGIDNAAELLIGR